MEEKADILMILFAAETSKIDPVKELYVISPDTDVLVNLRYHYGFQCNKQRIFRRVDIYETFEALG